MMLADCSQWLLTWTFIEALAGKQSTCRQAYHCRLQFDHSPTDHNCSFAVLLTSNGHWVNCFPVWDEIWCSNLTHPVHHGPRGVGIVIRTSQSVGQIKDGDKITVKIRRKVSPSDGCVLWLNRSTSGRHSPCGRRSVLAKFWWKENCSRYNCYICKCTVEGRGSNLYHTRVVVTGTEIAVAGALCSCRNETTQWTTIITTIFNHSTTSSTRYPSTIMNWTTQTTTTATTSTPDSSPTPATVSSLVTASAKIRRLRDITRLISSSTSPAPASSTARTGSGDTKYLGLVLYVVPMMLLITLTFVVFCIMLFRAKEVSLSDNEDSWPTSKTLSEISNLFKNHQGGLSLSDGTPFLAEKNHLASLEAGPVLVLHKVPAGSLDKVSVSSADKASSHAPSQAEDEASVPKPGHESAGASGVGVVPVSGRPTFPTLELNLAHQMTTSDQSLNHLESILKRPPVDLAQGETDV